MGNDSAALPLPNRPKSDFRQKLAPADPGRPRPDLLPLDGRHFRPSNQIGNGKTGNQLLCCHSFTRFRFVQLPGHRHFPSGQHSALREVVPGQHRVRLASQESNQAPRMSQPGRRLHLHSHLLLFYVGPKLNLLKMNSN